MLFYLLVRGVAGLRIFGVLDFGSGVLIKLVDSLVQALNLLLRTLYLVNTLIARVKRSERGFRSPGRVFPGKKMAGRMGGKMRTVQNLRVMKIDTVYNLIYVKGAVPGVDDAYVCVKDAIRKSIHKKTFPPGSNVPFPTFFGNMKSLPRELVVPPPAEGVKDPFSRTRREIAA
ncbi:54S ribosomal protein L3 [Borealophlyctis nickersoniae]|nr:54S ribosomal protein L3 [Borealophlyctis nickersoniae]